MQLITDTQRARLLANGERSAREGAYDPTPAGPGSSCRMGRAAGSSPLSIPTCRTSPSGSSIAATAAHGLAPCGSARSRNCATPTACRSSAISVSSPTGPSAGTALACGDDRVPAGALAPAVAGNTLPPTTVPDGRRMS